MRVFISQPMRGVPQEDINAQRERITEELHKIYPDARILDSLVASGGEILDGMKHPRVAYLGEALLVMAEADMVVMGAGWEGYPGCRIEQKTARYYDIPIRYEGKIC